MRKIEKITLLIIASMATIALGEPSTRAANILGQITDPKQHNEKKPLYSEEADACSQLLRNDCYEQFCGYAVFEWKKIKELRKIEKKLPWLSPAFVAPIEDKNSTTKWLVFYLIPDGQGNAFTSRKILAYIITLDASAEDCAEKVDMEVEYFVTRAEAKLTLISTESEPDGSLTIWYKLSDRNKSKFRIDSKRKLILDDELKSTLEAWKIIHSQ